MVEGRNPILAGVLSLLQVGPENGIVDDIQERADGMPALVVEPHLNKRRQVQSNASKSCSGRSVHMQDIFRIPYTRRKH